MIGTLGDCLFLLRCRITRYTVKRRLVWPLTHSCPEEMAHGTPAYQLPEPLLKCIVNPAGRSMSDRLLPKLKAF